MKITTQEQYEATLAELKAYCDKKGLVVKNVPDGDDTLVKQNSTFLVNVIANSPYTESGFKQKVIAEVLLYIGMHSANIISAMYKAGEVFEQFEGNIGAYVECLLAGLTSAKDTQEEEPKTEEPKAFTGKQEELSLTIGGVTLTPSKVREKLDEFEFEDGVTNDELFGALTSILKPVDHIDLGVDYNTPENHFKLAFGNLLFNEVNQTTFKTLEEYEEAYKDKPVIVVPENVSAAERAILNTFLERTLGEPTEENKVGTILRCLAMAYTYTDYRFKTILYYLSVLQIRTLAGFKAHMRNIAGRAYLALEKEKEKAYQDSVSEDGLDQVFSNPKREAEINRIKAVMEEPISPMPLDKVIPAMSSGGGSSSGSFQDVVDVAIGAAVVGVVGYGAYKIYDHFFGSGSAGDGDVELLTEGFVSLR